MAFTSWSDVRSDLKDAIAAIAAGAPFIGRYTVGGADLTFRSVEGMKEFYKMTYELESLDQAGETSVVVSHGRYRRFR